MGGAIAVGRKKLGDEVGAFFREGRRGEKKIGEGGGRGFHLLICPIDLEEGQEIFSKEGRGRGKRKGHRFATAPESMRRRAVTFFTRKDPYRGG